MPWTIGEPQIEVDDDPNAASMRRMEQEEAPNQPLEIDWNQEELGNNGEPRVDEGRLIDAAMERPAVRRCYRCGNGHITNNIYLTIALCPEGPDFTVCPTCLHDAAERNGWLMEEVL